MAAAIGAVAHLLPDLLPLATPLEGTATAGTDLGGAVSVVWHGPSLAQEPQRDDQLCNVLLSNRLSVESLSLTRQFAIEAQARAIDSCEDIETLRSLARNLLQVWQLQASLSEELAAQSLGLKHRGL